MTSALTITDVADLRQRARALYLESVAAEMPLTGKALGVKFGRSERWGRDRIAEARQAIPPTTDPVSNSTPVRVCESTAPAQEADQAAAAHLPAADGDATAERPSAAAAAEEPSAPPSHGQAAAEEPPHGTADDQTAAEEATGHAVPGTTGEPATVGASAAMDGSRQITQASVCVVAAVAAVVSYAHMYELAALAGEGWRAWLIPLSVDGLLVVAGMSMYRSRAIGERPGWLAWASLVLGLVASLAANVAVAGSSWTERLVAGWPPVALALAFELLLQLQTSPNAEQTR